MNSDILINDDQPLNDEDDLFGDHDLNAAVLSPVLLAHTCQFYNELSHRVRPSGPLHEVTKGRITSALSGAYAASSKQRIHNTIVRECSVALPHDRFNDKITVNNVPRDLRLENIYIFQLDSLKPAMRNGRSVFL
jgi:hypothetical protein